MRHLRTVLLLSAALGCGSASGGNNTEDPGGTGGASLITGGSAGSENVGGAGSEAGAGGSENSAGSAGVSGGGAGGTDSNQGGAGGTGGAGGSDVGNGGASGSGNAGAGGTDNQGGAGGSENQGGAGGTENQGGAGGSDPLPPPDPAPPACTFALEQGGNGSRCTDLLFETCTMVEGVAVYESTQCGLSPETGMMCDEGGGCVGECVDGELRCSGSDVERCGEINGGAWGVAETCGFQCVNGACEGACTPGNAVCDGSSVVTCGGDFRYGDAVACETAPNASATCSGAGECGTACVPGFDDCSAAPGCETDLSSPDACGACGNVCPGASNATRTCNGGVCGLTPNTCAAGTANCTGDFVCETNTDTDENNCGGCGIQCFAGATCNDGACSIETVSDFTALGSSFQSRSVVDMVLDGGHVYWWTSVAMFGNNQHSHSILRAPKTGGAPETLTTFTVDNGVESVGPRDNALLVDNGLLYWARSTGIFRMAVTGGAVTKVANVGAASLAIESGKLYWNSSYVNSLDLTCQQQNYIGNYTEFLTCNGSKVVTFYVLNLTTLAQTSWQTTQYEHSNVLGVQGGELFVARYTGYKGTDNANHYNTTIMAVDASTGANARTVTSEATVNGTTVRLGPVAQAVFTGSSIVFITGNDDDLGGLYQTPLGSNNNATLVASYAVDTAGSQYIAADASDVYLPLGTSALKRVSRSTSAASDVYGSPGPAYAKVAVDSSYVYWTADVGGKRAVLRTAK